MMVHFRENTLWAKTSPSFVFRWPTSVHPEVFRHANCNGTSFKAVWWSISEKIYLALKHYFPLYLQGQAQHTLRFSGMPIAMVQVSKLYDDLFQSTFGAKFHLQGQTQHTLRLSPFHNGTGFKAIWWSVSEKTHLGLKHHFPLYLQGQLSTPWGFQACQLQWYKFQSCMMIHFWENTFGTKTSLSFVFTGPNSAHPEVFSHANHNGTKYCVHMMMST